MDNIDFWHRQDPAKPLFPDLEWSRPENKMHAGKLLIVGGNKFGFQAPAEAYTYAQKSGIGAVRTILPNALEKTISKIMPDIEFASSTPSGSFGRSSLAELLDASSWADGVLLAGDFGKNSETTIVIESFINKYLGEIIITGDAIDQLLNLPDLVTSRPNTTLVLDFVQLQKLATKLQHKTPLTSSMDFLHFIRELHEITMPNTLNIVVNRQDEWIVASAGKITTTKTSKTSVQVAASACVWLVQNPNKPLEALTTSLL